MILTCDLGQPGRPFPHFWEHTVGSGYAALALRADWQAQIRRCRRELGFRYVRFHAVLSDEMGTVVCENGRLIYSFFNMDQVFDFLLSIGIRPFVELSFMPKALSSGSKTVFSYCGNVTPPKSHGAWTELIRKLATHWVRRYGKREVRKWFFKVSERAEPQSLLDRLPKRIFPVVPVDSDRPQTCRSVLEGRRTCDSQKCVDPRLPRILLAERNSRRFRHNASLPDRCFGQTRRQHARPAP